MKKRVIVIDVTRDGYTIGQCGDSMTVDELIRYLKQNCEGDEEIYLGHDNRYTFSAISWEQFDFEPQDLEDEEDEDEEENDEE